MGFLRVMAVSKARGLSGRLYPSFSIGNLTEVKPHTEIVIVRPRSTQTFDTALTT